MLFGQPELDEHLALPHMRQLKERITHSFTLAPLPPRDVKDYVNFRLRAAGYHGPDLFGAEALRIIAEASEGLTRRINIYADKTLLAAFAAGTHTVSADHARAASPTRRSWSRGANRRAASPGSRLAGLAVGRRARASCSRSSWPPRRPPRAVAATRRPPTAHPQADASPAAPVSAPAPGASPASGDHRRAGPAASAAAPDGAGEPPAPASAVDARLAAGRELLADASDPRYAVQLMVTDARERGYLETYLAEAGTRAAARAPLPRARERTASRRAGRALRRLPRARAKPTAALDALPEPTCGSSGPTCARSTSVREDARSAEMQ